MNRRPSGSKARRRTLRVWTLAQAEAAVPYISSIVRSLREHAVEILKHRRTLAVLQNRPGRPDRSTLLAIQEADGNVRRAEEHARQDEVELAALDIPSADPVNGVAYIPFVQDEQLAWYVFNLFDTPTLRHWRFRSDPEETRRPITPAQHGIPNAAVEA